MIPVTVIVSLLLVAALSVGALFLKYRIDHARSLSANAIGARIGVDFGFDALHTEGLRSLRIDGLHFDMPIPGLGHLSLTADTLKLTLSFADLFRGESAIGKAEVRGAHLTVRASALPLPSVKTPAKPFSIDPLISRLPSMDFTGDGCSIEYHLTPDDPPIIIRDIAFIASKDTKSSELSLSISASSVTGKEESHIKIDGAYRSPDTVDATIEIDSLTTAHIAPFDVLPEGLSGRVSVRLHGFGMINKQIMAELAVDIDDVHFPEMPAIASIANLSYAKLNASAQLDVDTKKLHLFQTSLGTDIFDAALQGTVNLMQKPAVLDITAQIGSIPADKLIAELLAEKTGELGEIRVAVSPDSQVSIRAHGPLEKPLIEAQATVPSLTASVKPADKKLPQGNVQVEQVDVLWDSSQKMPTATARLVDGSVNAPEFGVEANKLAGTVSFDGEYLTLRPMMASISGKPWSGTVSYSMTDREMLFDVNGTLTKIEETPLHDLIKKLWLGGDIAVHGWGSLGLDGRLKLQANADVTKGMVAFEWWLRKPVGVGASIHNIEVDMVPGKTLDVQGEAAIEDTRILAKLDYVYVDGKFQQKRIRVDVPHLEINSAGKCVQIPYTARGETCRDAYYESNIIDGVYGNDIAKIGGHFDYVSFLPDGGENPLICRDADVLVTLTAIEGVERSAALVIHAGEAHVPPFGDDWLLPLGPTEEYEAQNPPEQESPPQPWTYTLSADKIVVPPWQGDNFEAEVYSNDDETGFKFFRADCGNGRLEGTYLHEKQDNVMHLDATWNAIPATYLIRHLELPEVLEGDITGNMKYIVDQDDPRTTMRAEGKFNVVNGRFIPEELAFMLADTLGSSFVALHPDALVFNEVASNVLIEGDQIKTDGLVIDSEGMRITGDGVWVMEGDLDYNINMAITPDLAEQIPLLMDYFNVQGFRMTQQNIEIGFHLSGPTFSPSGQLAGLPPIGVTIVSGAAEMTGEAIKLLDTPRQMFMSIFRAGGGILGATRTQQQQPPPK